MSPLKSMSIVSTVVGIVVVGAFGLTWRHLWRWIPALGRWFPDFTGRWEGTYLSSYVHSDIGRQATGPIALVVRQGLFVTSVTARTGEMRSRSTRSWLEADRDAQRFRVGYTYESEPDASVRHRSQRHEGACWLTLMPDDDANYIMGIYYTERRSIGDLDLRRVSRDPRAGAS